MTETTKRIFEQYQIRKTKKQKAAFIDFISEIAAKENYSFKVEKSITGAKNIIIGDVDKADVVYTAHYDTCAVLPFPNFITPKSILIYLLYQILLIILIFVPFFIAAFVLGVISATVSILSGIDYNILPFLIYLLLFLFLYVLISGPANKHTANDNTSGVTALLDIMSELPPEKRGKVAFVFFDLEEAGLFGSMSFASKHKKAMKHKLLINFDCVSDGKSIILAVRKKAKKYIPILEKAFESQDEFSVEVLSKGVFYPSDQMNFPCGVGVAALKKSKFLNILYMNRIHTKRDVIYMEENIDFLKNCSVKLVDMI